MKALLTSVALILVATGSQAIAWAENKATSDTDFMIKAFTSGVGEVKISEYAAKHAGDEKVKDFANRLAQDHKALNSTIIENAKRMKVAVVAGQEKETQSQIDTLSKLKGNDFDREFLRGVIDGHKKAIAVFESESKSGQDTDLKTVAKNNLPTLNKHLEEAQQHLDRLKK